jgi:hypothetical protein
VIGRPRRRLAAGAALLAGLAACGTSGGTAADASVPGGGPDAAPPDAAADAAVDAGLPDLLVDLDRARVDLALRKADFAAGDCELDPDEACVDAPGERRLLHFAVETPNLGDGDMVLGEPDPDNPAFHYSECHRHYHFEGYAAYRLIDAAGGQVAAGRKQAFCLLDTTRYAADDPSVAERPRYNCDFQGIQRGWADVYHAALPCQFIDVTDVPDGPYTLEIHLNAERALAETDYDNDVVSIPVDLSSPALSDPTEPCPEEIADRASRGTHRECGWTLDSERECEPGAIVPIGCASGSTCGGSCTGDPMIRVCDADRPDGNCSFPAALRTSDDRGDDPCPCAPTVTCPPSGRIRVYAAPSGVGEAFTCEIPSPPG